MIIIGPAKITIEINYLIVRKDFCSYYVYNENK